MRPLARAIGRLYDGRSILRVTVEAEADVRGLRLLTAVVLSCLAGCGETPKESGGAGNGQESGARGGIRFVGFDASPPLVSALRAGQIQGLVIQDPVRMGYEGVKTLVAHLEGKSVESSISTGEILATPENMDEPEIAARLDPPRVPHDADATLSGPKRKSYRVMVIPKGTSHTHWQAVHAGARKAAEELGNVEIVWLGPSREDDRTSQIQLVENAVTSKVDGIVIAPLDSQALARPIDDAVAAGVPVVLIDSGLNSKEPVSMVATDNYHGGVLAAERLGELLGGKGRIILLRYAENSEATEQREKGFTDTIAAKFPEIEYRSKDQYAGATADSAQQVAQRLILQFKGEVDGVFCPNESSTAGMLRALKDAGLLAGE
jgi:ribose transport system substrate-binding protein